MLPAYRVVRFSDVHLEDRTKPSGDDIQALLSVQSAYIRLCKGVQDKLLRWSRDNYTLKTSALDSMIIRNGIAVTTGDHAYLVHVPTS